MSVDWESAVCRQFDPELWFPEVPHRHHFPARICDGCPIRQECLTAALRAEAAWGATSMWYVYGIYGALTPYRRLPLIQRVLAGEKAEVVAAEALDRRDYEAMVAS